jgi:uncharacterized protein (DUF697 family)
MKKLLIIFLMAMPFLAFGQKIAHHVIAAGGNYFEAASTNISWTLGELAAENFTDGEMLLTQGFQQGNMIITSIRGIRAEFVLKAYTNPVVDILIVETEKQDLSYRLVDVYGKELENGTIRSLSFELDFTSFPSGIYFLWVEETQTHKIIKK